MSMTILISVDSARLKAQNALCRMQFTSSSSSSTTDGDGAIVVVVFTIVVVIVVVAVVVILLCAVCCSLYVDVCLCGYPFEHTACGNKFYLDFFTCFVLKALTKELLLRKEYCSYTVLLIFLREKKAFYVSTVAIEAVLGRTATLPCDIEPEAKDDRVYMVLWFRESAGKPLYSREAERAERKGNPNIEKDFIKGTAKPTIRNNLLSSPPLGNLANMVLLQPQTYNYN
uniref:Ig-like domain-containing protein n=1 Tax=Glossina brevipalpis TaxID=37001 RepID=A0A1A9WTW0_9MUSC